jgi:hypothetical protein
VLNGAPVSGAAHGRRLGLRTIPDYARHARALQTHGASVTLYEQLWDEHEHALAEYEKGGDGATLPALAQQHQVEETKHDALREAHEQLKRRHHALVAALLLLEKAIEHN